MDNERKFAKDRIQKYISPYHSFVAEFVAERYPGTPLLDTRVELTVPVFAITWTDRDKLMTELAEVIKKYAI